MNAPPHPPIVMIHGAFCGGWVFDRWRTRFEEAGHRVFAPTLRHHDRGRNPPGELARTGMQDYAADIEKLIATLDAPPILFGHSLGGLLAQMIAARCPVAGIVLFAPSAPWGVLPAGVGDLAASQALLLSGAYWTKTLRPIEWIAAENALDRVPPPERDDVIARLVPESGLATFEIMHWPFDFKRATEVPAHAVTCPVLCVAGSHDRINPPSTVRRVAQRYRGRATFHLVEDHSHWLIGEPGWQKLAARVAAWLEDVVGAEPQSLGA